MFKYKYFNFLFLILSLVSNLISMEKKKGFSRKKCAKIMHETLANESEFKYSIEQLEQQDKIYENRRLSLQEITQKDSKDVEKKRKTIQGIFELDTKRSSKSMKDSEEFIKEKELEPSEEELAFIERLTRGLAEETKQQILRNYYTDSSDQSNDVNTEEYSVVDQELVPADNNSNGDQAKKTFSIKKLIYKVCGVGGLTAGIITLDPQMVGLALSLFTDD